MENVFMTTTERKRMSTKTTFKRIALVAVAALGLGVLSVAPSNAAVTVIGDTLTVSATSATIGYGETATITITDEFTSTISGTTGAGETMTIYMVAGSGTASVSAIYTRLTSDSANTLTTGGTREMTYNAAAQAGFGTTSNILESVTVNAAGAYTKGTMTVKFYNANATTTGTTRYTITSRAKDGTISSVKYFDLTTTGVNGVADSTKSLAWLNAAWTSGAPSSRADSALVISAGAAATPVTVGYIVPEFRNSADTNVTTSGSFINDSMTVVVSGPGLLTTQSSRASVPSDSTKSKSVKVSQGDTVVVWSDGTAGVGTFTASIGGVNLTQAAKTVTFVGKPATITAKLESTVVTSSGTAAGAISFTVKDSAGNAIKTNDLMNTGTPGYFYAVWADTKVASGTNLSTTGTAQYTKCATYNSTASRWECNLTILDSGTVSITIADSYTAATSVATTSAVTLMAVGAGYTGTAAFDKASYTAGEKAILTMTSKDRLGNNVIDGTSNPFASLKWGSLSPTFTSSSASEATGGTFTDLITYLTGTNTFVSGVDTAIVYMPNVAGTYTLTGTTNGVDKAAFTLTFTIVDPTKDAADAATDAALEATDAAYAAQDAAQLAAESADAATAAAEAATAAAEAATAAVEDLATKVAGLFADLQKQITTLANVVAKIAKKVKA